MITFLLLPLLVVLLMVVADAVWSARSALELRQRILELLALGLRRGVPLPHLLRRAATTGPRRGRRAMRRLAHDLESGEHLVEALEWAAPDSFPPACRAVLGAAEGSTLPDAIDALVAETGQRSALGHRWALALVHPVLLVLTMMLVEQRLSRLPANLVGTRWATSSRVALPWGRVEQWLVVALGFAGSVGVAWALWRGAPALRRLVRDTCASDGLLSRVWRHGSTAAQLGVIGHLVRGGRGLSAALRDAAVVGGVHAGQRVRAAADAIDEGFPVVDALRTTRWPEYAVQMVGAASRGSPTQLGNALMRAAEECRRRDARTGNRALDFTVLASTVCFGLVAAAQLHTIWSLSARYAQCEGLW